MQTNRPRPGAKGRARVHRPSFGWRRLGVVLGVAVFAAAAFVLYGMLRSIDVGELLDALRSTQRSRIYLAGCCVVGAYLTLTFYDYFALRTLGRRRIPYRVAALAGFTSYAVGHNVGATAVTGGTVRYRIYSAHGLDTLTVAKLCFLTGLTFWLGNATVLGVGIAVLPEAATAVLRLPPEVNRAVALAALAALGTYLAWVASGHRSLGRAGWRVALPGARLTLLQIAIGIVDLMCCTAAMYLLLPAAPTIDFGTLTVIFVSATLLGFASHAPGGLGVFDAAMLLALAQFDREDLLAGLLLFRLLYYIAPFGLAVLILGLREIALGVNGLRGGTGRPPGAPPPGERDVGRG